MPFGETNNAFEGGGLSSNFVFDQSFGGTLGKGMSNFTPKSFGEDLSSGGNISAASSAGNQSAGPNSEGQSGLPPMPELVAQEPPPTG